METAQLGLGKMSRDERRLQLHHRRGVLDNVSASTDCGFPQITIGLGTLNSHNFVFNNHL